VKIAAVLLAGGESRRMGLDKATLLFGNKPLWENQLELLRKLQSDEIFISARTDPAWRPTDTRFVADAEPSRGPLSGLAAALKQMRCSHLLALAIDMPFMSEQCLRKMCRQIEPSCGVLPMIGDRAEPLSAVYPAEVSSDFDLALKGRDFSLQTLTKKLVLEKRLRIYCVAKDEQDFYRNLNRQADLPNVPSSHC
jgi:molybdopterin-guanine dinucleotide biosynthesis protein A